MILNPQTGALLTFAMMADGLTFVNANLSTSVTQMTAEIALEIAAVGCDCSIAVLVEWLIAVAAALVVVTLVTPGKCDYCK